MNTPEQPIFKKPPVTEVRIAVTFPNNLAVSDARDRFHALVKESFPFVIMPDPTKLQYDFGDYSLYTQNQADHLEISMNYFRLSTASYMGFSRFRKSFLSAFSLFSQCYGISLLPTFVMLYRNELPLDSNQPFEDCFEIKVTVPSELQATVVGNGTLLFEELEGWLKVDIEPRVTEGKITSHYMALAFSAKKEIVVAGELEDFEGLLDSAHNHLRKYFFSLLNDDYLNYLKTL